MDYPASKTCSLDIAFVVDADNLRRLSEILREVSSSLEFAIKFSDGTNVQYVDIEEVIGQPNSPERVIIALVAGTGGEGGRSAYVNLKKADSPSLEHTLTGIQRDVIYFADKLDDWVASVRQWYSPFFSSGEGVSAAGAILLLGAFLLPIYMWEHVTRQWTMVAKGSQYRWIALPVFVVMWTAEYFLLKLFPRGTFATGHGQDRHQHSTYIRNTVIGGLAISIVGSIFANWVSRH